MRSGSSIGPFATSLRTISCALRARRPREEVLEILIPEVVAGRGLAAAGFAQAKGQLAFERAGEAKRRWAEGDSGNPGLPEPGHLAASLLHESFQGTRDPLRELGARVQTGRAAHEYGIDTGLGGDHLPFGRPRACQHAIDDRSALPALLGPLPRRRSRTPADKAGAERPVAEVAHRVCRRARRRVEPFVAMQEAADRGPAALAPAGLPASGPIPVETLGPACHHEFRYCCRPLHATAPGTRRRRDDGRFSMAQN
jgi:hypothetical protein